MTEQEFRQQILQKFTEHKALDFMFEQVKQQAQRETVQPKDEAKNTDHAGPDQSQTQQDNQP